jgi:hypothetical protein
MEVFREIGAYLETNKQIMNLLTFLNPARRSGTYIA